MQGGKWKFDLVPVGNGANPYLTAGPADRTQQHCPVKSLGRELREPISGSSS